MTVEQMAAALGARVLTKEVALVRDVKAVYTSDLLSRVMTNAGKDTAWITVQTHMNMVAVASLLEFSCVIVPEGIDVDENIVAKAEEEGIALLSSDKGSYELSGMLYAQGIAPAKK